MYRHQKGKHVILLKLVAQYGSEAILKDIYNNSTKKWKIHVSQKKFQDYMCTDDLNEMVSYNFDQAQWIHACSWKDPASKSEQKPEKIRNLPCHSGQFEVRQIKPSAMYFSKKRLKDLDFSTEYPVIHQGGEFYRVCYSCHSSLEELLNFVHYFPHNKLIPIVIPQNRTKQDVMDLLTNGNNEISLANISGSASSSEDMFDVGSTPEKNSVESDFSSPPVMSKLLKRKSLLMDTTTSTPSEKHEEILLKYPEEKKKKMAEPYSVDEIDFTENTTINKTSATVVKEEVSEQSLKRRKFRDSKMSVYSLPVMDCHSRQTSQDYFDTEDGNSPSRRASLPPNIKIIPDIKIIPSTPSPVMPDEQEWNLEAMKCSMDSSSNDNNKSAVEKPNENCSSSSIEIIDISSDDNYNAKLASQEFDQNESIVRMDTTTSEIDDCLDSTPELDEVYASAKNDQERQNILKYAELMNKKDLLKL